MEEWDKNIIIEASATNLNTSYKELYIRSQTSKRTALIRKHLVDGYNRDHVVEYMEVEGIEDIFKTHRACLAYCDRNVAILYAKIWVAFGIIFYSNKIFYGGDDHYAAIMASHIVTKANIYDAYYT